MAIGVKPEGLWWDEKYYPSVAYVFNLVMDPMEKMDPHSHEWRYIGRKFFAQECGYPPQPRSSLPHKSRAYRTSRHGREPTRLA